MAEYIEREELINAMNNMCNRVCDYSPAQRYFMCGSCTLGSAFDLVEEFPAADVQPVKWIPVTERLPEEYKNVLCYYEYFRYGDFNCMFRTIDRGYYGNGTWGGEAGQGHKNKVLAWMPLPKLPEDGET